jgi:hypothetical protein
MIHSAHSTASTKTAADIAKSGTSSFWIFTALSPAISSLPLNPNAGHRPTRYSSWEVYGKVKEAVAKDHDFAKVLSQTMEIAELTDRNIAVSIDL